LNVLKQMFYLVKRQLQFEMKRKVILLPNSIMQVSTYENKRWFCALKIKGVHAITFSQLSNFHAKQENMTLSELKCVIQKIYPNVKRLYVISYEIFD
jgi:uncharacterized protein YqfB (UPF0267 family)